MYGGFIEEWAVVTEYFIVDFEHCGESRRDYGDVVRVLIL